MAKYRLTEPAFIGNVVWPAETEIGDGTQVPFSGIPGPHMEPMDDEAKKEVAGAKKSAAQEGRAFDLLVMNNVPIIRQNNAGM
jgi:hypothetical protein